MRLMIGLPLQDDISYMPSSFYIVTSNQYHRCLNPTIPMTAVLSRQRPFTNIELQPWPRYDILYLPGNIGFFMAASAKGSDWAAYHDASLRR